MGAVLSTLRFGLQLLGLLSGSVAAKSACVATSREVSSEPSRNEADCRAEDRHNSQPDRQQQPHSRTQQASNESETQALKTQTETEVETKIEPKISPNKLTAQSPNHESNHEPIVESSSAARVAQASSDIKSEERVKPALMQSIPVGQSLDAPDTPDSTTKAPKAEPEPELETELQEPELEPDLESEHEAVPVVVEPPSSLAVNADNAGQQPQAQNVEEAVIKIQALVRGHLARKALKGADGLPLGQRQFDDKSLSNRKYLTQAY